VHNHGRNSIILARFRGDGQVALDVAGAVVFLASSAADYIHWYVLAVDGGWMAG